MILRLRTARAAAAWLALTLPELPAQAASIVTSYLELIEATTQLSTATGTENVRTITRTRTVKSGVLPTAFGISSSTTTSSSPVDILTIVYVYLPVGAIAASDLVPTTGLVPSIPTRPSDKTIYVASVTYTAPSSCPTPFTVETVKSVEIPSGSTVNPTSTGRGAYRTGYMTAYLPPGAVPVSAATTDPLWEWYISDCRNPTATGDAYWGPGGSLTSSSSDSRYSSRVCGLYGCLNWTTLVIILASVIPSLFFLGFAESFFWFRRLMLGHSALRFGTFCWIMCSLWMLCFTRTSPARSQADQEALKVQWNNMGAGMKWKLWWKWGFRHAYPAELLGPDPRYPAPVYVHDRTRAVSVEQLPRYEAREGDKVVIS